MKLRVSIVSSLLAVVLALTATAASATPSTYLFLNSQSGDWVGQGQTLTLTPADGTFSVSNTYDSVSVSFDSSTQSWSLQFGSPINLPLGRGEYEGATRTAFRSPTAPGVDVSGDGHGCNTVAGRFLVSDFALTPNGAIARLAIDFEQHCDGVTPALYGSIRYNSSVAAIPRFGIGAAHTLKGNTGTSDSSVILSLSMPSTSSASVQYVTEDGTAVQGTDYVASSGTVTFPAGTTSSAISIPILGDRLARGNKAFRVHLITPAGAPIGAGTAGVVVRDPNVNQTVLAMYSQPGDFAGGGLQYLMTLSDGAIVTTTTANLVETNIDVGDRWTVDLAGPTSAPLTTGTYLDAQRYPFQPSGTPALSVYGGGCNTITGNFEVLKAAYTPSGTIGNFAANFEQHCEGAPPALFGWLRIHDLLQQFSVSDAVIQGQTAVFTVTLNPSVGKTVSVNFATADGTAVGGTDYTPVSQTVTFSAGMTAQTISVPLLSPALGSKTFYGQLSQPSGVAVWIRQASATF